MIIMIMMKMGFGSWVEHSTANAKLLWDEDGVDDNHYGDDYDGDNDGDDDKDDDHLS